ncbi:pentapeptide repeat-containing protein [Streptomyces sp. NPDC059837]|uniref:pentapeptide repeat-containing protein n=1 Tax=unclassified Streptomyces TaxID=2593676 RepID=UPI003651EC0D
MVSATSLPGIAAVIALIFTFLSVQQAHDTLRLSEEGQITDRYTDAVTNLGSNTVDVRLGGIYALQRIMTDSSRDQSTVIRVLSAFVRVHAPESAKTTGVYRPGGPPSDVTAALEVLALRDSGKDGTAFVDLHEADMRTTDFARFWLKERRPPDLSEADLRLADLTGSDLGGANLSRANLGQAVPNQVNFTDADLRDVKATGADFRVSDFTRADLTGADLVAAKLVRASLRDADLSGADLSGADVRDTSFLGANLRNTSFSETDLTEARDLTAKEIVSARLYTTTILPVALASNPQVQARIAELAKKK